MSFRSLFICICLLAATSQARANCPPEPNDFGPMNEFLSKLCEFGLRDLFETRCRHYFKGFEGQLDCALAAGLMIDLIDFRGDFSDEDKAVSFLPELVKLLGDKEALKAISQLTYLIEEARQTPSKGNLWEWTLELAQGNREKAIKWLAVFLQDTTRDENGFLLIKYLRTYLPNEYSSKIGKLENLMVAVSNMPDSVVPYPSFVDSKKKGVYHFYVPAYLAQELKKNKLVTKEMATYLPFLLVESYEQMGMMFETFPQDQNIAISFCKIYSEVNSEEMESRAIDGDKHSNSLQDIYLGYAGSEWGSNRVKSVLSFKSFEAHFAKDPMNFVRVAFGLWKP